MFSLMRLCLSVCAARLVVSVFSPEILQAQIEQVTFTWDSPLCGSSCEEQLKKQLSKISGVSQVSISPGSGQAVLTWKPKASFSFSPLNSATRMIGIRIHNVHVKVKGKPEGNSNLMRLRSEGDGTSFILISPPQIAPGQAAALYNPQAYPLSSGAIQQLTDAQKARLPVTIEGALLEPERGPPLYLIVGNIQVEEPAAQQQQKK